MLDTLLQKQLRLEAGGGAYSSTRADYLRRIDSLFGEPGSAAGSIRFPEFLDSDAAARFGSGVADGAAKPAGQSQGLTATLNSLSENVQLMRAKSKPRSLIRPRR